MTSPTPVTPQLDETAADGATMVEMGVTAPPPIPSTDPFLEPDWPLEAPNV
ncbi:hypothetical protein ACFU76_04405 [Streptomyces sp. NPDC057539]|uniref:hypothetical protein n=1 Tax=Streptomyces sp. NPDC057539 TaxID=3346159 RepID=UPI0036CECF7B